MQSDEIVTTLFLNSDLLAPNHAATSIVEVNEDTDYEKRKLALEQERELEIERLQQEGKYEETSWFWPFGGGPTVPLEADRKLEALEQEYAQLELERVKGRALARPRGGGVEGLHRGLGDGVHATPYAERHHQHRV